MTLVLLGNSLCDSHFYYLCISETCWLCSSNWLATTVLLCVLSHPCEPVEAGCWVSNMLHHLHGGDPPHHPIFTVTVDDLIHPLPATDMGVRQERFS